MDASFSTAAAGIADGISLQNCLTCYLCGDIFKRPRILPCGHTFCSECLARLKDEILRDGEGRSYRRGDASADISWDQTDGHRDCPAISQNGYSLKPTSPPHRVDYSTGSSDSSSNVDYIQYDVDPNCYRPRSSKTSQSRKPDHSESGYTAANGIRRSNTFTRESSPADAERSPSRFSAPPGTLVSDRSCVQCGYSLPSTPSRRGKASQRSSSFRDKSPRGRSGPRWDNSPQRTSPSHFSAPACSFEHKHGREMEQFVCPLPECNYSLRVMNLARWSPKNKTVADVISVWKYQRENMQDASTQTEISTNQSVLVTIPRSLVDTRAVQPLTQRRRHSSMMDMAIDSAISMDSLERGYIPRGHLNWRSYAAMVGMNILHQIVNL